MQWKILNVVHEDMNASAKKMMNKQEFYERDFDDIRKIVCNEQ